MNNNLIKIADGSVDILKKNAPKVLLITGIGAGLGAVTASGLASYKANEIIKDIKSDPKCDDKKEAIKAYATRVLPLYIPVAILEAGSVVCLVKSYDISAKRLAAATALAQVSMETLRIYKDKAKKIIGEEKSKEIDEAVREEQKNEDIKKAAAGDPNVYIQLFRDEITGQEFYSTKENILRAQLELNNKLHSDMYLSVNEWIDILNDQSFKCDEQNPLVHTLNGDQIGWEEGYPIYISFRDSHTKDGKSCFEIGYNPPPRAGYRHRYW